MFHTFSTFTRHEDQINVVDKEFAFALAEHLRLAHPLVYVDLRDNRAFGDEVGYSSDIYFMIDALRFCYVICFLCIIYSLASLDCI